MYVSPSVEEVLGYKPEHVIGQKYTDFIPGADPLNTTILDAREHRFNGDIHHQSLRAVKSLDGETRVLRIQACGKTNELGQVVANHRIAIDVTTAYFKEEKMLERYRLLTAHYELLSEREQNVLSFVVAGKPNKSIAKRLDISERGVENIRSRLFKKFAVNTSAELVSKAREFEVLTEIISLTHFAPLSLV